jgi:NAD(P)-dependent dehydrogenase (short-subunit alcohol dehydrogenase family)
MNRLSVTGGASGIGRAIVERFVAEGAQVAFGDVNEAGGKAVAAAEAAFMRLDVANEDDWIDAMRFVKQKYGRLDVLVNNAGIIGSGAPLMEIELERWNQLWAINVTGVMLGCKHCATLMRCNPGGSSGSIINMSSNAGILGAPDFAYSATKGAVRLMTKSIGVTFAREGLEIRCNSIHPGPIDTPIFDPWKAGSKEPSQMLMDTIRAMTPMGRFGRAQEIASMALFLASDESAFCTGAEFVVDGGGSAGLPAPSGISWKVE